ncbi:MAG: ATPase [Crocinitomicaceae bacterium]|nr:ATPase [Crocinitomicaceae bacterium]|tara:strand:+ start:249 stop:2078 length:1830 start_codon:yes stop_codon:yes gene_type:complete
MSIREQRERINLWLYDSKKRVLSTLRIVSFFVSFAAVATIIYRHGFPVTDNEEHQLFVIIQASFAFYILHYFIKFIYDFKPLDFLRRNWFEGLLMLFLIIEAASYHLFDTILISNAISKLGFKSFGRFTNLFLQLYLLVAVGIDLGKQAVRKPKFKIHPSNIFIITFVVIILLGTFLLMLPEMSIQEGSMNFLDAIFTSTSATCVTGLIVVDTSAFFTFKGQFIIMMLMKLGGLNIIAFGASLNIFAKLGLGMRHHSIVEDFMFNESVFSSRGLLVKIITGSIIIELVGALMLFLLVQGSYPTGNNGDAFFFSIFHSISAFNNAGFSILEDGMCGEYGKHLFLVHFVLSAMIFVGALGFDSFFDLFGVSKLRERLNSPWKRPKLGSLLNLYTTVILVIVSALLFLIFEWDNTMKGYRYVDKVITSLFQVISMRTAGFSSVDFHDVTLPMIIATLFFMFIGGASSSTAGGIKTSTFAILALSAYSTIRGKKNIEVFNRTISKDLLFRAFATFLFAISAVLVGIFVLSITEGDILAQADRSFTDLVFEVVSAFSTVGMSTGITSSLSVAGKITIIISMFVGRIGTLTIAFALSKNIKSTNYKYPEEHMLVG